MQVIKHINDLKASDEMSRLIEYLKENVQSRVVVENIQSKEYLLSQLRRKTLYCECGYFQPGASPEYLIRK